MKWADLNGMWPIPTKGSTNQADKAMPSNETKIPAPIPSVNDGAMSNADYIGVMYLINRKGAAGQGHAATLLLKENGMGEFYSYAGEAVCCDGRKRGVFIYVYTSW